MVDFTDTQWDWGKHENRDAALYGSHPCWGSFYGRVLDAIGKQTKLLTSFEDTWERSIKVYGLYRELIEGNGSDLEDSSPGYRRWLLDQHLETSLCGIYTGEEGHDSGDDLIWASEHDSDDPEGFLRQLWDGEWSNHENWGDEELCQECWDAYASSHMSAHILTYERIKNSIGEEFQKVREQVYDTIEKRRTIYLELDQDPEDDGYLHYSDFSDPLRNSEILNILAFTDEQIQEWIKEAKEHGAGV